MKLIKRIPFQLFLLNLFTGIVCITGIFIMQHNLNEIVKSYKQNIEGSFRDRLNIADTQRLISRYHIIVSWHTMTALADEKLQYEEEAAQLKEAIIGKLNEMGESIADSEKEQLFHTVYSNTISYFSNGEKVFQLSSSGSNETAKYYITSYLTGFIDKITADINILDSYIVNEMDITVKKMEQSISIAEISEKACIVCIVFVIAVCIIMCVRITSRLEKYKNQLEAENEHKTKALIEHNRKMLAIQENTIIGMANLIDSRDHDTGEHVKRTSRYVELLAHAAQKAGYCSDILTDDYIELLIKAAPMHDIGKIVVSDAILQKKGRLTAEEFEAMKEHAAAGGHIIVDVMSSIEEREYIDIASQIAESHHEKWDGSGYPNGSKGDEIPICARIMAVADVFDALVSKRCYKDAIPADEAFEIIISSGGSHFDPELARLFCSIRPDIEDVLNS